MKKKSSIIKEILITLLLCIAIVLVLLVIFYDYNPIGKIVPNKVTYTTPENVSNEIQDTVTELEKTNVVYTVEGSDLTMYQKNGTYVKGKANPFASSSSTTEENTTIENNSVGGNTTNTDNSNGTFFKNEGLK